MAQDRVFKDPVGLAVLRASAGVLLAPSPSCLAPLPSIKCCTAHPSGPEQSPCVYTAEPQRSRSPSPLHRRCK